MLLEGIQTEKLCKIGAGAKDKATTRVDAENKLETIFKKKYRIRLNHQILTDNSAFYPTALFNDLVFELVLAPASQVVKGSNATKLTYKLKNIEIENEMVRSKTFTQARSFCKTMCSEQRSSSSQKNADKRLNIKVNPRRRSLKGIPILFVQPYAAGARDSETFINPDLTKVSITNNGSPNRIYNEGINPKDIWEEVHRFFTKPAKKTEHMNLTKFYTGDKFRLLIDLRSIPDQTMHGSGTSLVNTKNGFHLEIERNGSGSGNVNCHVFTISDSQMIA